MSRWHSTPRQDKQPNYETWYSAKPTLDKMGRLNSSLGISKGFGDECIDVF